MKERRADESVIARNYRLGQGKTRERGEEKESVFGCSKTERHNDHINDRIDRLIILVAPEDDGGCDKELEQLLDASPKNEREVLNRRLKTICDIWMGGNVGSGKLLDGDDEPDRDRAGKKGERNEALRLRMSAIFPQPKPQPHEG